MIRIRGKERCLLHRKKMDFDNPDVKQKLNMPGKYRRHPNLSDLVKLLKSTGITDLKVSKDMYDEHHPVQSLIANEELVLEGIMQSEHCYLTHDYTPVGKQDAPHAFSTYYDYAMRCYTLLFLEARHDQILVYWDWFQNERLSKSDDEYLEALRTHALECLERGEKPYVALAIPNYAIAEALDVTPKYIVKTYSAFAYRLTSLLDACKSIADIGFIVAAETSDECKKFRYEVIRGNTDIAYEELSDDDEEKHW